MKLTKELPFTHPSYAHEKGLPSDNQRLEFLGDAILDFILSDILYQEFPEENEGFLSKSRSGLVSREHLARKSRQIGLERQMLLGVGEDKSGGRENSRLLADTFEAYIAYIYLKKGLRTCRKMIRRLYDEEINRPHLLLLAGEDHKSALQERLQATMQTTPVYSTRPVDSDDHTKGFLSEVKVKGEILASGRGNSKKEAEQDAARNAIQCQEEKPHG